ASSGLFFAAEGSADLGAGGSDIDVGDAAVGAGGGKELLGFAEVHGKDGGGETLRDFVVQGDGGVEIAVLEDVEDGGKGLVLDDLGLVGDFDERGADVEGVGGIGLRDAFAAGDGC